MKKYGWLIKGAIFGLLMWLMVYVIFPNFNEAEVVEPEKHLLELLFAFPAGILWGYYRFKVLPKRLNKNKADQNKD